MLAGSVASSTTLASPDLIVLTLTEFADQVRRIMRSCDLSLIVDAAKIPTVLRELSRGRFITVTNMTVTSKDPAAAMLSGYYYGQVQIVQLDLECEELLLHAWLTKYMPDVVKGGATPPAAP